MESRYLFQLVWLKVFLTLILSKGLKMFKVYLLAVVSFIVSPFFAYGDYWSTQRPCTSRDGTRYGVVIGWHDLIIVNQNNIVEKEEIIDSSTGRWGDTSYWGESYYVRKSVHSQNTFEKIISFDKNGYPLIREKICYLNSERHTNSWFVLSEMYPKEDENSKKAAIRRTLERAKSFCAEHSMKMTILKSPGPAPYRVRGPGYSDRWRSNHQINGWFSCTSVRAFETK